MEASRRRGQEVRGDRAEEGRVSPGAMIGWVAADVPEVRSEKGEDEDEAQESRSC